MRSLKELLFPTISLMCLLGAIMMTPMPSSAQDPECPNEYCDETGWNTCEELAAWSCVGVFHCDPDNDTMCGVQ
jgi:hypothetical protein